MGDGEMGREGKGNQKNLDQRIQDLSNYSKAASCFGSSLLGMVRSGGINRLNPDLARDLID
ncbi:hypothetical protein [Microcystis aeruginosa]|jgi:hypothetical protein|uniref:Uncharacterized protein n=2 Tax=Microcystis TaxID=1125 RepID=A0A552HAR3_MICVR|nr:hypothetical protein [Microcystis aeruginosa]TRU68323.1 MAG: hypothetical protein EWV77_20375 [Microcystis viridis Mv_BB_P_19951000_S68D]TRU74020.1 MAG: hypothetical protein EWV47_11810 [Microcystis viridis Mv_BB_P_19951000_S68]TRU74062.1 MAG: hypothetical protein EWV55_11700 [Microcystis viridis Mv_BB_P_19951000_S69]TRU87551.1 MAG: hypothetical protein EWV46_07915 [Microcystis viridis Mv_BB_P_19951000_S69D]QGZ90786.1 hypothetical protein GQR42_15895 [Microcystis aeruginosa FD4]